MSLHVLPEWHSFLLQLTGATMWLHAIDSICITLVGHSIIGYGRERGHHGGQISFELVIAD